MKIKIIDLLNKIENGEEVPKKILLNGIIFEYQGDDYLYKDEDKKEHWLFSASYTDKYTWLENFLKAEVEIIEEPKKLEKWGEGALEEMEKCTDYTLEDLQKYIRILAETQNELIDEVNNLKDK